MDRQPLGEKTIEGIPVKHVDVVILGCGVSGLTSAQTLTSEGFRCAIVDTYDVPGGNHISQFFEGLEFDIGAIYFHSTDTTYNVFPTLAEAARPISMKMAKINRFGAITRFPLDIRSDLGGARMPLIAPSLFEAYSRRIFRSRPPNTEEYVRNRIGSWLYQESGLASYISRMFGMPPDELDVSFARDRLGWVTRNSSIRHLAKRQLGFDKTVNASNRAVAHAPGGFSAYYGTVIDSLADMGVDVRLGCPIEAIIQDGRTKTVLTQQGPINADRVVSTIPIPIAAQLAGVEVPRLDHVRLLSLFVESEAPLASDAAIIYNFDSHGRWKRLTMHSNFYNRDSGRTGFAVEVPFSPNGLAVGGVAVEPEAVFDEFAHHVSQRGLAPAPLRLLGSHWLEYAYPILDIGCVERRDLAMTRLTEAGIDTLGRQGGFDYIPHSTVAVRKAKRRLGQDAKK